MQIISLSGLDGSGKSTQIELLKDYLKSQDKTFFYFHAVDFSIGNKMLKRGKKSPSIPLFQRGKPGTLPFEKGEPERDLDKSVTKANWLQIQLRKIALFIDVCRFKRLIKKLNIDYIISDRYFYDSVVNILFLENRRRPTSTKMCAEKYVPKPDFAFYINVKPETIMQRERKPDQGLEYLVAKDELFKQKIKDWNMIVVDGEKSKDEIFNIIKLQVWGEFS
jgi:thymidylate kinase